MSRRKGKKPEESLGGTDSIMQPSSNYVSQQQTLNGANSTSNVLQQQTDEEEELNVIMENQRRIQAAQQAALSPVAQQTLQTQTITSSSPGTSATSGFDYWGWIAIGSRYDQFRSWAAQKYQTLRAPSRALNLVRQGVTDPTKYKYEPSQSMNFISSMGPRGQQVASQNMKTGSEKITALVELLILYDALSKAMADEAKQPGNQGLKNSRISLERQVAEAYVVFVYLSYKHDNAAQETVRMLESIPVQTKLQAKTSLTRSQSGVMVFGESIIADDPVLTRDINAIINGIDDATKRPIFMNVFGQLTVPEGKLPAITDEVAATVLYESIIQKRSQALGKISKPDVEKALSGPLGGIIVQKYSKGSIPVTAYSQQQVGEAGSSQLLSIMPLPTVGVKRGRNTNTNIATNLPVQNTKRVEIESTSNVLEGGRRRTRKQKQKQRSRRSHHSHHSRRSRTSVRHHRARQSRRHR